MYLNRFTPKNKSEQFLLLFTKITDTLIKQTKTKPQETLEFKLNRSYETFSFDTPL